VTEYGYIVDPLFKILKYTAVFMLLFVLYKKVIAPFAQRMVELPVDEEATSKKIFDEEEVEDDSHMKLTELKKRVTEKLGIGGSMNEESLRHEVLLEKLRELTEDKTLEVAEMLQALVADELSMQGDFIKRRST